MEKIKASPTGVPSEIDVSQLDSAIVKRRNKKKNKKQIIPSGASVTSVLLSETDLFKRDYKFNIELLSLDDGIMLKFYNNQYIT